MIVTFYSFKGGVGRSMAMANVAEVLASAGYHVIVCDWDLEAPGLERYVAPTKEEVERAAGQPGLIDLLAEYKTMLTTPLDEPSSDTATTATHANVGRVRLRRPSSYATDVRAVAPRPGSIRLLTAGARGFRGDGYGKYAEAVRLFSWTEFYQKWAGGAYMDFLRADLSAGRAADNPTGPRIAPAADIVLIDSRTGVTEHGGVATHHLSDLVVLMSAANDLNLEGTAWMANALLDPKLVDLRSGRKLAVLPVPSRIEQTSEKDLLNTFRKTFAEQFGPRLPVSSLAQQTKDFFLDVEIPYMPFYSFTERVAAREPPGDREERLYRAYVALAFAIIRGGFELQVLAKAPIETPARFQALVPLQPPRGLFALVSPPDMRGVSDDLTARLNQLSVRVSTDLPQAAAQPADVTGWLILAGPSTPASWVRAAFDSALRWQAVNPDFRIVPAIDAGVRLSAFPDLSRVRCVQLPLVDGLTDVAPIVSALVNPAPALPEDSSTPPFPGVRPFDETDARFFFGRDAALAEMAATAKAGTAARWWHVDGPVGIGKTSFVLAGVLPALRLGTMIPNFTCGPVAFCRPGTDPLGALALALAAAAGGADKAGAIQETLRSPGGLAGHVRQQTSSGQTFVLFVDDVHTLDEHGAVAPLLMGAIAGSDVPLLLITAADSEWSGGLVKSIAASTKRYRLPAMSAEDYRLAATAPARLAGLTWEPDAVDRLAREAERMTDAPVALPLFAAALRSIWDQRTGSMLTAVAYERFGGGLIAALIYDAERRIGELPPQNEQAVKRFLVALVWVRADGTGVRGQLQRANALALAGGGAAGESLIALLSSPPAVIVDGDWVELSHDALTGSWLRLQQWIREAQAGRYRQSTRTWIGIGVAAAAGLMLLVGGAQAWVSARARARALSETLAANALRAQDIDPLRGLAIAVAAGSAAQTPPAQAALDRALTDRYPLLVYHHPAPVIDAALRADNTQIVTVAEDNSIRIWKGPADAAAPALSKAFGTAGQASSVRFGSNHNDRIAAVTSFDGTMTLIDTGDTESFRPLRAHTGPVVGASFSPNGELVGTASLDGTALIWDVKSTSVVTELRGHAAAVSSVLFRPDGNAILTTSLDGSGRLWDLHGATMATITDPMRSGQPAGLTSPSLGAFGGSRVAIAGIGGAVVWSPAGNLVTVARGHRVTGLAFVKDGSVLVTSDENTVHQWDPATGAEITALDAPPLKEGQPTQITDLAVDPGGSRIAAGTADGRIFVWRTSEPVPVRAAVLRAHTDAIVRVAFDAYGVYLFSASKDDTVCIWDIKSPPAITDRSFASMLQFGKTIVSRAFTPDQLMAIVK